MAGMLDINRDKGLGFSLIKGFGLIMVWRYQKLCFMSLGPETLKP